MRLENITVETDHEGRFTYSFTVQTGLTGDDGNSYRFLAEYLTAVVELEDMKRQRAELSAKIMETEQKVEEVQMW